jgi:transcriptional regulator with GAF, ATPase, and Fis domain
MASIPDATHPFGPADHSFGPELVCGFSLDVIEGPDRPRHSELPAGRCTIGSAPSCDLVIADPTVSRFHCELTIGDKWARIRDLGSRNGTFVDGTLIESAFLRTGSQVRLGQSVVRFQRADMSHPVELSPRTRFGSLVGNSTSMRATFAILEKIAATDSTLLLQGETGTGKSAAARSIHLESRRNKGPFIKADCAAIPASLLESEFFGHARGAFTGAIQARVGAFEAADGGTLFLDEIGELPLELQPKLLLALDQGEIHRVGDSPGHARNVDVRIIAATNRDLRAEVNAGRFREDLYYRLAVFSVELPPLRERPEDLPDLVRAITTGQGYEDGVLQQLVTEPFLARLRSGAWPGNIRELANYVQRCLVFESIMPLDTTWPDPSGPRASHSQPRGHSSAAGDAGAGTEARAGAGEAREPGKAGDAAEPRVPVDATLSFRDAKQQAVEHVERFYFSELMRLCDGNVNRAAEIAQIDRASFYRKLRKLGIKAAAIR